MTRKSVSAAVLSRSHATLEYMVYVIKGNGEQEVFKTTKLDESLKRAGVDRKLRDVIVSHIESELEDGMTTSEIYRHAFDMLKMHGSKPSAARYSLKRALMELGPSGFPFEHFVARIFEAQGYRTETGSMLRGKCAEHEVDVVAENDEEIVVCEAKFHNTPGFKSDLKVALYVEARFRDLKESNIGGRLGNKRARYILITNTKFTRNARDFVSCNGGFELIAWSYPHEGNLEALIEQTGLHPITCLTTLSKNEKQQLMRDGYVLCRAVKGNGELLRRIGVTGTKATDVLHEAEKLCVPMTPEMVVH